jgi:hypothetical protein
MAARLPTLTVPLFSGISALDTLDALGSSFFFSITGLAATGSAFFGSSFGFALNLLYAAPNLPKGFSFLGSSTFFSSAFGSVVFDFLNEFYAAGAEDLFEAPKIPARALTSLGLVSSSF